MVAPESSTHRLLVNEPGHKDFHKQLILKVIVSEPKEAQPQTRRLIVCGFTHQNLSKQLN